jgi:hypothetical protein
MLFHSLVSKAPHRSVLLVLQLNAQIVSIHTKYQQSPSRFLVRVECKNQCGAEERFVAVGAGRVVIRGGVP